MCATLIVAAATAAGQNAAQDYPQWRGKSGDGSASAFIGPSTWPDALTRRWSIEVGEGYATPLVIGDTVYVFARRDGDEALLALTAQRRLRLVRRVSSSLTLVTTNRSRRSTSTPAPSNGAPVQAGSSCLR